MYLNYEYNVNILSPKCRYVNLYEEIQYTYIFNMDNKMFFDIVVQPLEVKEITQNKTVDLCNRHLEKLFYKFKNKIFNNMNLYKN